MNSEGMDLRNKVSSHILKTLLYFDIFNYPLKDSEVFRFLGTNHVDHEFVKKELHVLADQHYIFRVQNFFSLQNQDGIAQRRIKGNEMAERAMGLAKRQAQLIIQFPFVRSVMASGSLSKGYMDENSDLDFFIITEPGKLWIARTLLVLYKRIFLFNSHKHFCVNYFVDSDHLEIEEKNLFTATELATVLPLAGTEYYTQLQQSNPWLVNVFPNFKPQSIDNSPRDQGGTFKKSLEWILTTFFSWTERLFMDLTLQRWRKQYGNAYPSGDFKVAFKTKPYASKNHPRHFQKKVIDRYHERILEFEKKYSKALIV